MSTIDRQRIGAVRTMEALGYTFDGFQWHEPASGASSTSAWDEADPMHSLLVLRADKLVGCTEGSDEETEFRKIAGAVSAYEAERWPDGKLPGGKG